MNPEQVLALLALLADLRLQVAELGRENQALREQLEALQKPDQES